MALAKKALVDQAVYLAAVGDLHCSATKRRDFGPIFAEAAARAHALLLCGDLTDTGLPQEADRLVAQLQGLQIPVIAVLGNHDYESGKAEEVRRILLDGGVVVLDGTACEFFGVGFAGVKGFAGGFGLRALQPWGEETIKRFVREGFEEAMKLESALAGLRTERRVALMHYSPVRSTVVGEDPEVFPFLGSSRLEEPLDRYRVDAVFHGHAHAGSAEGRTRENIPVYNVALPLLESLFPDAIPLRVVAMAAPSGAARPRPLPRE